jgi:hypothetical protein
VYAAPGNSIRMASIPSAGRSLQSTAQLTWGQLRDYLPRWLLDLKLQAASLLVVLNPKLRPLPPDWLVPWRWILPSCTAGLLLGGTATHAWITTGPMEARTVAGLYLLFLLGWFATVLAWAARLPFGPVATNTRAAPWILGGAGLLFAISVATAPTARTGYVDLLSHARRYDAAMKWRYRILDGAVARGDRQATIPKLPVEPTLFFHADVDNEAAGYHNWHTRVFYGLDSLTVVPMSSWRETSEFHRVTPCRLRESGAVNASALTAGSTTAFAGLDLCGIPGDAKAIALNVTVADATAEGDLRVYSSDDPPPAAAHFFAQGPLSYYTDIDLSAEGLIFVRCDTASSTGSARVILFAYGYYR